MCPYGICTHYLIIFRDEYFKGEDVQKNGKIMFDELVQQMEDDLETQTMINRLALTPALEDFKVIRHNLLNQCCLIKTF